MLNEPDAIEVKHYIDAAGDLTHDPELAKFIIAYDHDDGEACILEFGEDDEAVH